MWVMMRALAEGCSLVTFSTNSGPKLALTVHKVNQIRPEASDYGSQGERFGRMPPELLLDSIQRQKRLDRLFDRFFVCVRKFTKQRLHRTCLGNSCGRYRFMQHSNRLNRVP